MLEYMSTAKHPVHGFQDLASDFMDLSGLIWTIDAGIKDAAKKNRSVPQDVTSELSKRFRQVYDEFIVLSSMVTRLVEHENKKPGIAKAFRSMFSNNDIDKVRNTLIKSRESLRMGSAMFRWTTGELESQQSMGIGYTGLAAAIQRSPSSPGQNAKNHVLFSYSSQADVTVGKTVDVSVTAGDVKPTPRVTEATVPEHPSTADITPPLSPLSTIRSPRLKQEEQAPTAEGGWHAPDDWKLRAGRNGDGLPVRRGTTRIPTDITHSIVSGDWSSNDSTRTFADNPDALETLRDRSGARENRASKLDAFSTRPPTYIETPAELTEAVQSKRHALLEQLLHRGSRAEPKVEAGLFRTAVQNRDMETLELLLSYGGNPNGKDKDCYSPLYVATEESNMEAAKLLIKLSADPNLSAGPRNVSPLCLAACEGHMAILDLLLTHGGDPNSMMANNNTVLIHCVDNKVTVEAYKVLIAGIDVNVKNDEGATALFQSILANRIDLLEVLLDNGANPNLPAPKHPLWPSTYKPKALQLMLARGADVKKTPGIMELASSLKKLESIKILMAAGVSPNVRKDGVYTPLCSAIRDNSTEIVTYLLEHGADPNLNAAEYPAFKSITHNRPHFLPQLVAAGVDLRSPRGIVECAIAHNNREALLYLLDQDVPVNDKSAEGKTALTTAIRDDRIDLVELLLKHGADPAVRGADWPICMAVKRPEILKMLLDKTPNPRSFRGVVEMAVVADQLESIKLLLAAGVCVEDKNCGVFSPLTTAIRERNKHIVRYLLEEAKADPNAPGEHLPIVKALRRLLPGDTEILQLLLARGADINKMHRGWNAILQAIENGDAEILQLLMDNGGPVDLQLTDEVGKTVLETLQERGWAEGMALLCPELQPQE